MYEYFQMDIERVVSYNVFRQRIVCMWLLSRVRVDKDVDSESMKLRRQTRKTPPANISDLPSIPCQLCK